MKNKFTNLYMKLAEETAKLSSARRLKVGAVIVKDHRVISLGYNGTPAGWDNNCEIEIENEHLKKYPNPHQHHVIELRTKPEVIHAEANAIAKLARDGESGKDATMFLTHNPCIECAKLIYGAGISKVYYKNEYRNNEGVEFLNKCNIGTIYYENL